MEVVQYGSYHRNPGPALYKNEYGENIHIYYPITDYLKPKPLNFYKLYPESHKPYKSVTEKYSPSHDWYANEELRLLRIEQEANRINRSWLNRRNHPKYTVFHVYDVPRSPGYTSPRSIVKQSKLSAIDREHEQRTSDLKEYQDRLRTHQRYKARNIEGFSDKLQQKIHGKSADVIAQALLNDAIKNVAKARIEDEIYARSPLSSVFYRSYDKKL